jgi:hypothetical protein
VLLSATMHHTWTKQGVDQVLTWLDRTLELDPNLSRWSFWPRIAGESAIRVNPSGAYVAGEASIPSIARRLVRVKTTSECLLLAPFRTKSPPTLRLEGGGAGRVRSAALVWLLRRRGKRRRSGAFLVR